MPRGPARGHHGDGGPRALAAGDFLFGTDGRRSVLASAIQRLLARRGAPPAAARPGAARGDGNLPCVGDMIRENTRLRAALHDREVELASARAELADLREEIGHARAVATEAVRRAGL